MLALFILLRWKFTWFLFFFLLNGKISVRILVALTVSLVREKNQIKNKTERQQLETQTGKNKHLE